MFTYILHSTIGGTIVHEINSKHIGHGTMYHNKTETKSQYYNWTQLQITLIAVKGQEEAMLTNIMIATLVQNVKLTKKR